MIIAAVIIVWIICGILAYSLTFAYFQREFPLSSDTGYYGDCIIAIFIGILGLFGLIIHLVSGNCRHGFKWR